MQVTSLVHIFVLLNISHYYTQQIENEEYGEALALAKAYGLDCDLVYQRQWRKTPVSVASIQDYLVIKTFITSYFSFYQGS